MNRRKYRRLLRQAFCTAGADKVFYIYFAIFFLSAVFIWLADRAIDRFRDSLWYCFAVATTVGFGDFAATALPGRIVTVILSLYSLAAVAIFTAVITSYFMDVAKSKASDSARAFLDDLEHLQELSPEELKELSARVQKFRQENM